MVIRANHCIRAIIFDLGGVLVRTVDFSPRQKLAERYGMTLDELMRLVFGNEAGERAQRGLVTIEQHWEYVRQSLGLSTDELSDFKNNFWGNDFLDLELVNTLRRLRSNYRTALLSNAFDDLRWLVSEKLQFADAFDEMIISAEVGFMKPDPRIYNLALERLGVDANEAVFVDDMLRNVEGAQAVGMLGILYKNTPQVLADLNTLVEGG